MSINAVQPIWSSDETGPAGDNLRVRQNSSVALPEKPAQPNPGSASKQEIHLLQSAVHAPEIQRDEVQVQRDSEANGEIVIRYMDRAGDVILQVPSPQMLNMARAINQDFEHAAKVRAAADAAAANEGGDNHGN